MRKNITIGKGLQKNWPICCSNNKTKLGYIMNNDFNEELNIIINEHSKGKHLIKLDVLTEQLKKRSCIIYGAGSIGQSVYSFFSKRDVQFTAFCDEFKSGIDTTTGAIFISPDKLLNDFNDATLILAISNPITRERIQSQLMQNGFHGIIYKPDDLLFPCNAANFLKDAGDIIDHIEQYSLLWDILTDDLSREILLSRIRHILLWEPIPLSHRCQHENQYFESDIINLSDNEVFVDGGFFIGDTTAAFINRVNGKYKHIYGFEPDAGNIANCKISQNPNISIIPKGLWSENNTLRFTGANSMSSKLDIQGDSFVPVTSIDSYFLNNPNRPTFIKLDVEGAEKEVLIGAKKIISECKPMLAVCVYHKPEDLYVLPEILLSLNSKYRYYLRHYNDLHDETVLYAVM